MKTSKNSDKKYEIRKKNCDKTSMRPEKVRIEYGIRNLICKWDSIMSSMQ